MTYHDYLSVHIGPPICPSGFLFISFLSHVLAHAACSCFFDVFDIFQYFELYFIIFYLLKCFSSIFQHICNYLHLNAIECHGGRHGRHLCCRVLQIGPSNPKSHTALQPSSTYINRQAKHHKMHL